jgi:hypothetical protein
LTESRSNKGRLSKSFFLFFSEAEQWACQACLRPCPKKLAVGAVGRIGFERNGIFENNSGAGNQSSSRLKKA